MKFDYCAMHAGSVIGEPELICRVIRHDDGTKAKPSEVWAELEMLRDLLRECRLALIWSADEANDAFLARLDAAIGDDK